VKRDRSSKRNCRSELHSRNRRNQCVSLSTRSEQEVERRSIVIAHRGGSQLLFWLLVGLLDRLDASLGRGDEIVEVGESLECEFEGQGLEKVARHTSAPENAMNFLTLTRLNNAIGDRSDAPKFRLLIMELKRPVASRTTLHYSPTVTAATLAPAQRKKERQKPKQTDQATTRSRS
jgi:hypothetical protein